MTDTTDIKTLREFLMEQIDHVDSYGGKIWLCAEDARLAMSSLSQIEAERQRADNASFRENHLNDMLNDKIQQNVDLRAEIAALKGDQVPVGKFVFEPSGERWHHIKHGEHQHTEPKLKLVKLFTAPQKPIVLPAHEDCQSCDRHYVDGMRAGWNFHEEGDNQGFIDSIERVQKDMREARNGRVKNDA